MPGGDGKANAKPLIPKPAATLTSIIHHRNVIMTFLPFANAVIVTALALPKGLMRDWHVHRRFRDFYGEILRELLLGVDYTPLALYREFSSALKKSADFIAIGDHYFN